WPTRFHPKRFEAALRVPKRQTSRDAYQQIKNAPTLFASPRLPVSDEFAIKRARTKGNIHFTARDRFNNFWELVNRRRKIGVEKNRNRFRSTQQPASDRCAFPAIRKIFEQLNCYRRRHRGNFANHFAS